MCFSSSYVSLEEYTPFFVRDWSVDAKDRIHCKIAAGASLVTLTVAAVTYFFQHAIIGTLTQNCQDSSIPNCSVQADTEEQTLTKVIKIATPVLICGIALGATGLYMLRRVQIWGQKAEREDRPFNPS